MKSFLEKCFGKLKSKAVVVAGTVGGVGMTLANAGMSHAAFVLPAMPVTDLETAGGTVAAFVAIIVIIGCVIRLIKKA